MTVSKITSPITPNELIDKTNEIIDNLGGGASIDTTLLNYYGTCDTAAATQAKVVVCPEFTELKTGVSIRVKFTNAQTYNGVPTLNVNSTGAKSVNYNGTKNATRYCWLEGEVVAFTYDGTNWLMEDAGLATTSYYGYTKLQTSASSTNSTVASTPASLYNYIQGSIVDSPLYSSSSTYNIGDRVRYNWNTWECITAITTAEAWNAEHWKALAPIQTQIDEINANKVTESTVSDWGFTKNTGTVTSVNNVQPVNGNVTLAIPTVNNGTLTIQKNGTTIGTFTANQSGNSTVNIEADTVLTDDITVSKNSDNELQAVAVIDNNSGNAIKTWTGTKAEYDAIVTKDANTLYNITDDTDVTLALLELLFPVGAVYFGTMSTCPLQTLGVGTWQALPSDKVIQIAGTRGSVGSTLKESLPNVKGSLDGYISNVTYNKSNGALVYTRSGSANLGGGTGWNTGTVDINASRSSSTYQDNAPVQQDAYLLNGWRRIA